MKKLMFLALGLIFCLSGAMAQQANRKQNVVKSPEARAENFTRRMTKELSLDNAQQERVKVLNLDRFKKIQEIRNSGASQEEIRTKVKEVNDTFAETMKGILSAEQFTKFQTLKEDMKEKAFQRKKGQ